MMAHGVNSPPTSSLGRLFDAVATLLGLRDEAVYEGQAAIELEAQARLAAQATPEVRGETSVARYPFRIGTGTRTMDVVPMIQAIVRDLEQGRATPLIAWRFHVSLAEMLAEVSREIRQQTGLNTIALSGGVFQNRLLLELLMARLEQMGSECILISVCPPNDGGISLGQAAIAAARLRECV